MPLEVGNVVTVMDPELRFYQKQGEVVEVADDGNPDGPIGVRFREGCSYLLRDGEGKKGVRFKEGELRRDADWTPANKADRLFGRSMWHTVSFIKAPLDTSKECMREGCPANASKRIMMNCWGLAFEADVCESCAREWHGVCLDSFPWKAAYA